MQIIGCVEVCLAVFERATGIRFVAAEVDLPTGGAQMRVIVLQRGAAVR